MAFSVFLNNIRLEGRFEEGDYERGVVEEVERCGDQEGGHEQAGDELPSDGGVHRSYGEVSDEQCGNVEDAIEKVNDLNLEQGFLEKLERMVALLAFEDVANCPVGELLEISQRLKTSSEVNAAILTSQSCEKV
ncbi:hypothetical protein QJS10_CPA01g02322 [Acorus calamus]|uniref:CTLH/CRA C-terminal to LisH motif domain-containing protein n=1 Tax=Acorus calamus TaxID=4465 RepID=A0AAV9FW91_ACOCL|nr:hypothetical protein QJS10_CPA01g02322 [Acorus calamus]